MFFLAGLVMVGLLMGVWASYERLGNLLAIFNGQENYALIVKGMKQTHRTMALGILFMPIGWVAWVGICLGTITTLQDIWSKKSLSVYWTEQRWQKLRDEYRLFYGVVLVVQALAWVLSELF